jgi:hypothetical protein
VDQYLLIVASGPHCLQCTTVAMSTAVRLVYAQYKQSQVLPRSIVVYVCQCINSAILSTRSADAAVTQVQAL